MKPYILLLLLVSLLANSCGSSDPQVRSAALGELRDEDGTTPLIRASRAGNTQEVVSLLAQGADVNAVDNYGWTALIWSADKGHTAITEALIKAGADINHKDTRGATPLIRASARGNIEDLKLLLAAKADISARTTAGSTALMLAANKDVRDLLEKAGAKE